MENKSLENKSKIDNNSSISFQDYDDIHNKYVFDEDQQSFNFEFLKAILQPNIRIQNTKILNQPNFKDSWRLIVCILKDIHRPFDVFTTPFKDDNDEDKGNEKSIKFFSPECIDKIYYFHNERDTGYEDIIHNQINLIAKLRDRNNKPLYIQLYGRICFDEGFSEYQQGFLFF